MLVEGLIRIRRCVRRETLFEFGGRGVPSARTARGKSTAVATRTQPKRFRGCGFAPWPPSVHRANNLIRRGSSSRRKYRPKAVDALADLAFGSAAKTNPHFSPRNVPGWIRGIAKFPGDIEHIARQSAVEHFGLPTGLDGRFGPDIQAAGGFLPFDLFGKTSLDCTD